MISRKLAFSATALSLVGWKFYNIETPKNYEAPNIFRLQHLFIKSCITYVILTRIHSLLQSSLFPWWWIVFKGMYSESYLGGFGNCIAAARKVIAKVIPPAPVNINIQVLYLACLNRFDCKTHRTLRSI